MARDKVEKQLELLSSLRVGGPNEAAIAELRKALTHRVNVVTAKAAQIAGEWQCQELLPDLLAAFARLFVEPAKSDPQCWGKNAVSRALKDLGCTESAVFLRGLQHRQWESTWGGKTDTALILRGTCALALVQCNDITRDEILRHLVEAVTEPEAKVRTDAVRALEQMGGRDILLLLRLKARAGDVEPNVTGQALESILQLDGAAALPFVLAFFYQESEEVAEEAALALGASRLPEAIDALLAAWPKFEHQALGRPLLRAVSSSRQDSALHFLLELVKNARERTAEEAVRALALHSDSEEIVRRVELAVGDRPELLPLFQEKFRSR